MRAINHALTGSLIGLAVGEPLVAVPAALASHFVCDVIPHHGSQIPDAKTLRSKSFRNSLMLDAALCGALVLLLATRHPIHWLLAAVCAFAAASPDFVWFRKFRRANEHKSWKPTVFEKWAGDIQWFQRPIGAVVEAAWFVAAAILLVPFLR